MKNLKETLKNACVYTVIITFFFAFVGLFTFEQGASIPLGQYFILMLFGFIIACAQHITEIKKFKPSTRYIIHFLTSPNRPLNILSSYRQVQRSCFQL